MMRGCVVVSCYSRPEAFEKLVKSIYGSHKIKNFHKLFLIQESPFDLHSVLEKYRDNKTSTVQVLPTSSKPLININHNRWNSQIIAFDLMGFDWCLILEEDIAINPNTLIFVEKIMNDRIQDKSFKGINLGSYELQGSIGDYSIVSQGIHGQASAISRGTWIEIKKKVPEKKLSNYAYDWLVEPIFRRGYVVVPNRSLFVDNGWSMPTHAPSNRFDQHYVKLECSYVDFSSSISLDNINLVQIEHSWFGNKVYNDGIVAKIFRNIRLVWQFSFFRRHLHNIIKKTGGG